MISWFDFGSVEYAIPHQLGAHQNDKMKTTLRRNAIDKVAEAMMMLFNLAQKTPQL